MVVPGELLCVTDSVSGVKFLADTRASYSCLPFRSSTAAPEVPSLKGAGGHGITSFGKKRLEVVFAGRRFEWTFLLAAVEDPIIGADFLRHYKLIVNLSAGCLMDAETLLGAAAAAEELASKLRADAAVFVPLPLRQRSYAEVAAELPAQLQRAEYVYIRRRGTLPPLACKYEGPDKALERAGKYFIVQIGAKRDSVSVDRLKPYTALGDISPAAPPQRGRLPIVAAPAAQ
jgi:hypothetical protein